MKDQEKKHGSFLHPPSVIYFKDMLAMMLFKATFFNSKTQLDGCI